MSEPTLTRDRILDTAEEVLTRFGPQKAAVVDVLATKAARAAHTFGAGRLALGGGVAANRSLLRKVEELAQVPVLCPPPRLCTDNAAMIASAGFFRYRSGERADFSLDVEPGMPIA